MAKDGVKNFIKRARRANPSDSKYKFKDFIGEGDNDDIYRFKLGNRSKLKIKIKGLRTDVDAELYTFDKPKKKVRKKIGKIPFSDIPSRKVNKFLNLESNSSNSGSRKIKIKEKLDSDNYYLRITPNDPNEGTKYKVVMKAKELPAEVIPGDGSTDGGGTTDGDGGTTDGGGGTTDGGGSTTDGDGGTTDDGGDTTDDGGDTTDDGDTNTISADNNDSLGAAQALTVDFKQRKYNNNNLPSGFTDRTFYLGGSDTNDYFSFNLATESVFNLDLNGLSSTNLTADLDVQVLDQNGLVKASSTQFGTTAEEITNQTLSAGDYYIRVFKTPGTDQSDYSLTLSALPTNTDPNGAGETPDTAATLTLDTELADGKILNDFVGGADTNDYFKINLSDGGFIGIDLDEIEDDDIDGRTSNINLQIIPATSLDENGNLIEGASVITSSLPADNKEEVAGTFDPGTYYIRVYPATEDDGAFYRMKVTAYSTLERPSITRDIAPGLPSSLTGTTLVGDTSSGTGIIYFFADDGTGNALWKSEGTYETTEKVKKFEGGDSFDNLINIDGKIYFTTRVSGVGNELYLYDGSGFKLVEDSGGTAGDGIGSLANDGIKGSPNFTVADGKLYFVADDGTSGTELWVTDPNSSTPTATQVSEIATGSNDTANANPDQLTYVESGTNKVLYFVALDKDGLTSLYTHDVSQTISDTKADNYTKITTGLSSLDPFPSNLALVDGDLYFSAYDTNDDLSLWVIENAATNSTPTKIASSTAFGNDNPDYAHFTEFDGTLYFVATDDDNRQDIWRVDRTITSGDQVEKVASLGSSTISSLNPTKLTVVNTGSNSSTLYFIGNKASSSGSEFDQLWSITDNDTATAASVTEDTDLYGGFNSSIYQVTSDLSEIDNLTAVGSGTQTLYFTANNGSSGNELYKVDGALSNISDPFANIGPDDAGVNGSDPSNLVEVGGRLYFKANNNTTDPDGNDIGAGTELWVLGIEDTSSQP